MLLRCYPKITDWIYFLFNQSPAADYRFLPVYSYGFCVAMAFLAAATIAVMEMRRREKLGLLKGQEIEITYGEAPSLTELTLTAVIGFTVFFKITGIFAYHDELRTGQLQFSTYMVADGIGNLFSKAISIYKYGSWFGGIIGAAALCWYYFESKNSQKLDVPELRKTMIYPSDSIGDLVVIAALLGVSGSAFFNFLEDPGAYNDFWANPIGNLFSGLSIYGGLICAGAGFVVFSYVKKFHLGHFLDSIAPGFILANGIGRIGCQLAGDGDWGIDNLLPKPGWLPQFLWSSHYANNIINMDPNNPIPGCQEEHCWQLVNAVYPTPIYEFLMCTGIFLILWALRKRLTYMPGTIFTIFMMLIGIQRYAIEQWRSISDRGLYHVFGHAFRQSELISIIMFITGLAVTVYLFNRYRGKVQA
jgi:prolipoprotein diacylglyceryltransferase